MKVALVHDYLIQYGGAERVLEILMRMFPEAPIYTLLYDEERTFGRFRGRVRKTSFLDRPLVRRQHRPFIPLMPFAARLLRLDEDYDLVISDSAGFGKGIHCGARAFHIAYCHTPLRYAWEAATYFSNPLFKAIAFPAFRALSAWDLRAARRPHLLLANSEYIAEKIRRHYGREAAVVYPPVDTVRFAYDHALRPRDYLLAVGRFLHYKRFDLVIDAFRLLGLPLKIVGSGPAEEALRKRSAGAPNITFVPFVQSEEELRTLYGEARALIFPQAEDFGLVAAEAQSCGTPVIAFREGGAREIIDEGRTGVFFDEQRPEHLATAVNRFSGMRFNRAFISRRAARFGKRQFEDAIRAAIPRERISS